MHFMGFIVCQYISAHHVSRMLSADLGRLPVLELYTKLSSKRVRVSFVENTVNRWIHVCNS